jgi:endonuclease/exonuclease/phosphatase family metal-dependent hydrolase
MTRRRASVQATPPPADPKVREAGMRRFLVHLGAVFILVSTGWFLVNQGEIHSVGDVPRLVATQWDSLRTGLASTTSSARDTLRIASFNIQSFGAEKASNVAVMQHLVQIVRQFDIVAIQELRGQDEAVLRTFLDMVNADGRQYAMVASEPIGRNRYFERYAFLFDRDTVILDGSHTYTVNDPDDLLHREPLVGWFRAAGVPEHLAFTFSLANLHLDSRKPDREVAYLSQLFRAIRLDGRGEDDVIIAGDFNASPDQLQRLRREAGLACLITEAPTNVRSTRQYDNLLVDPQATCEYTGSGGVFDFLRAFNLTIEQAVEISDHLPVWADFSTVEGSAGIMTAALRSVSLH